MHGITGAWSRQQVIRDPVDESEAALRVGSRRTVNGPAERDEAPAGLRDSGTAVRPEQPRRGFVPLSQGIYPLVRRRDRRHTLVESSPAVGPPTTRLP